MGMSMPKAAQPASQLVGRLRLQAQHLKSDGVLTAESGSGPSRLLAQELCWVELASEALEVGPLCAERGDAPLHHRADITGVGGAWHTRDENPADPAPRLEALGDQFREDPAVTRVLCGVAGGEPNGPVISLIEVATGPEESEVRGDYHLWAMLSDRPREATSQW